MRIHFSNVNFSSSSGPNAFAYRLANELAIQGHEIVNYASGYDIFLCFIEPTNRPHEGSKFIQRLDGIWFKPEQFDSHNKMIKLAYDNCDHVIWQSDFDKKMTERWWGTARGTVIGNGIKIVSPEISNQLKDIRKKHDKIFVCAASWHRQKRLKENILLFQKLAKDNDILFVLGENPDYRVNDKRVLYVGNVHPQVCLQIYSIADWMIHLAWLDHCPNVTVEAMSQLCPIIYSSSGGTGEIVKENGIAILESIDYKFELCDYDNPPELDLPDNLDLLNIDVDSSHLKIEAIAQKYLEVFNEKI